MDKVANKTSDLVGSMIIKAVKLLKARVKTLAYDGDKDFSGSAVIDETPSTVGYFASCE